MTWLAARSASLGPRQVGWPKRALAAIFGIIRAATPPESGSLASAKLGHGGAARAQSGGGDIERFEAFFQRHQHGVFGYLWRLTGEEQAAYDLSQETFLRAWQRFARLEAYEQPRAWLFRVATNLALNHQRHHGLLAWAPLHADGSESAGVDLAVGVAERDAVRDALLAVPPRQRAALVLRTVYGFSFEELARMLGTSIAAARMMSSRGRAQFRSRYLREEEAR